MCGWDRLRPGRLRAGGHDALTGVGAGGKSCRATLKSEEMRDEAATSRAGWGRKAGDR